MAAPFFFFADVAFDRPEHFTQGGRGKKYSDFPKKRRDRRRGFLQKFGLDERAHGLLKQVFWRGKMSAPVGIQDEIKLSGRSVPSGRAFNARAAVVSRKGGFFGRSFSKLGRSTLQGHPTIMTMKQISSVWMVASIFFAMVASAAERQALHGHVPEAVARLHLQPIGRLPATNRLHLAIGLPLRNREPLANLLEQLYDPASTNYHHYLTPPEFAESFGPAQEDYQAVIAFATTNGLTVTGTYANRTLLDVNGSVADIEKVFHITGQWNVHAAFSSPRMSA